MTFSMRSVPWPRFGLTVAVLLLPGLLLAAERRGKKLAPGHYNPDHATVEMFAAIEKGQIEVKLIPKDSKQSRVMIENKTDKPLNVKLPGAFAGVPVLAQINNNNAGGGNQGMGGGMGMMGGGGMGGGMGMMNIAPERVGKLKLATVCLEHGKNEPRPAIPYEIKPIESLSKKPEIRELCRMLGSGRINQRAAQVAAWHLNNNMSFEELASKRLHFANGTSRPYFSAQELQAGMNLTAMAVKLAKEREQSPGQTDSASLE